MANEDKFNGKAGFYTADRCTRKNASTIWHKNSICVQTALLPISVQEQAY